MLHSSYSEEEINLYHGSEIDGINYVQAFVGASLILLEDNVVKALKARKHVIAGLLFILSNIALIIQMGIVLMCIIRLPSLGRRIHGLYRYHLKQASERQKYSQISRANMKKITSLPNELQMYILKFLDVKSLLRMASTSKHWNRMIYQEDTLWRHLLERDFETKSKKYKRPANVHQIIKSEPFRTTKSSYFHLYRIKYVTYCEFTRDHNTTGGSIPNNYGDIVAEEALKSINDVFNGCKIILKASLLLLLTPLYKLQKHIYLHQQPDFRYSPKTSLQLLIAEFVSQSTSHYSHLHLFVSSSWYLWSLFAFQTCFVSLLAFFDFTSMIFSLVNISLVKSSIICSKVELLYPFTAVRILNSSMQKALMFLLLSSQVFTLILPLMLRQLLHRATIDTDSSKSWVSNTLASPTNFLFDPLLITPIVQLLWIVGVYSSMQERTMFYIDNQRDVQIANVMMLPVWTCIFVVRFLVYFIQISSAIIFACWLIGTNIFITFRM